MVTKRIIPCLDIKDGRVVKGVNFLNLQDVSNPVKLAGVKRWGGQVELVGTLSSQRRNGPPSWCGSGAWWRSTPTPTRW